MDSLNPELRFHDDTPTTIPPPDLVTLFIRVVAFICSPQSLSGFLSIVVSGTTFSSSHSTPVSTPTLFFGAIVPLLPPLPRSPYILLRRSPSSLPLLLPLDMSRARSSDIPVAHIPPAIYELSETYPLPFPGNPSLCGLCYI